MDLKLFEMEPYKEPTCQGLVTELLFTDGGCIDASRSSKGVTWAWALVRLPESIEIPVKSQEGGLGYNGQLVESNSDLVKCVEGQTLTNNVAEYLAILNGLEEMVEGWDGAVVSDSKISLGRYFWDWKNKGIDFSYIKRKDEALKRLGNVRWIHVDGHPSKKQILEGIGKRGNIVSKWNQHCDSLCNLAKEKYEKELI